MGDKDQFKEISDAMKCIGISDDEIRDIFKIVSGVMAFGNVQFVESGDSRGKQRVNGETAYMLIDLLS